MADIGVLPDEILVYIFQFMLQSDIVSVMRNVCRRWKMLSFSPTLWRRLCMVDLGGDTQKIIWSDENIQTVKSFVKNLYISLFSNQGGECLNKLIKHDFSELKELTLRDSHFGNSKFIEILEFVASRNTNLSCLSVKFGACEHLEKYFDIISNIQLRTLEINHGGSALGLRQKCKQCSEEKWEHCLVQLCCAKGKDLRNLSLGVNRVNDETVSSILKHCSNLTTLELDKTNTTYSCFMDIQQNINLRNISLFNININDDTLISIAQFAPFLISFFVEGNLDSISTRGIQKISESCRFLEQFSLRNDHDHAPKLTDSNLFTIASNCKSLKYIQFQSLKHITDAGLQAVFENCSNLQTIIVNDCFNITDKSLINIGTNCKRLKRLEFSGHLTGYNKMTSAGFQHILCNLKYLDDLTFASLKNLKHVRLYPATISVCDEPANLSNKNARSLADTKDHGNHKISDLEFNIYQHQESNHTRRLHDHCHLKSLSLARCDSLDDESILQILNYCPDLHRLDLFNCVGLTLNIKDSIFDLCEFIPEIKIDGIICRRK
ncbi:Hypothetical predicted protein [Mytilus galloprovincialis]|uniref:F-box domain-containing protein n=1 Tax=Mytilus galloprovincialis TaxID=29158 RepID=A0A8B6GJJ8_MYTGA|nr:Hypothetical predicted protein [Mytilus galloprovincialis]